jgi:hypothetical protein
MAGQNRFSELKKFSAKQLKLKQDRHLDELKHENADTPTGDGRFSHGDFKHLRLGICLGLSVKWLDKKLNAPRTTFRNPFRKTAEPTEAQQVAELVHPGAEVQLPKSMSEAVSPNYAAG